MARDKPPSNEQIAAAYRVDLLTYLQRSEPDNLQWRGNRYCLKDHESLYLTNGKWYWASRQIGGHDAMSYLMKVRGMEFGEAVSEINGRNISPSRIQQPKAAVNQPRKPLALPEKNWNNAGITSYLLSRGIDREVIDRCISEGILYESRKYHGCVFVGKDREGTPKYACVRGTVGSFKQDVTGSEKQYGFVLSGTMEGSSLCVTEAAIDALSLASLHKQRNAPWQECHYLSLGGVSTKAALRYIKDRPEIKRVYLCLDNDDAGIEASARLAVEIRCDQELDGRGLRIKSFPPAIGKDYNEMLCVVRRQGLEVSRVMSARKAQEAI